MQDFGKTPPLFGGYQLPAGDVEANFTAAAYMPDWEASVRRGFVRKVFGILAVQLLLTTGFAAAVATTPTIREYATSSPSLLALSCVLGFAVVIALGCSERLRRTHPYNLIALGVFTLSQAFLVAMIAATTPPHIMLAATGITAALCVCLVCYALQTKYDFTMIGGSLLVVLVGLLIMGILAAFMPQNRVLGTIYAAIGAVLFSVYLVYDVQLLLSGKRMQLDPDEYVMASLSIYLDILNLFLFLLQLLNSSNNN